MPERPWFKFYPANWQGDAKLRMCSLAARGLWAECIAIMHDATPYGHLVVDGHAVTDAQLAVLVGAPPEEVSALIAELGSRGVFSRTRKGVIYSRRMTRDDKKRRTAQKNGRLGGNPSLLKTKENLSLDKGRDKARVKPQRIEDRGQTIPPPTPSGVGPPPRGARLPEDWIPTDKDREYAREKGMTDDEIDHFAAEFRDYWIAATGRSATKINWPATWRNRVRRLAEQGRIGRRGDGGKPVSMGSHGKAVSYAEVAAQLASRRKD